MTVKKAEFMRNRTLALVAVMLLAVACILFAVEYYSPAARYRRTGDEGALRALLAQTILPHDSIDAVKAVLGPATPDVAYHERLMMWQDGPHFIAKLFPDGIERDDVFLIYHCRPERPGAFYPLQFRAGQLINFDPINFEGVDENIVSLSD